MMKNKTLIIVMIVILSLLVLTLTTFMVVILTNKSKFINFRFGYNKISDNIIIDESYDIDFDKVNIVADASDIEVNISDDDKFKVLIYSDKADTKVETDDNNLSISVVEKSCFGFCFHRKLSKIEVYVPKNYANLINIENKYGDIDVAKFSNADIKIEENCGDVKVLGGKKVTIDNDYGDITLDYAKEAQIKESAGDVKIGEIDEVIVTNNLGDINIEQVNHYLDIKDDCGDIKVDSVTLSKDSRINNNLGDIKIKNVSDIYIDADTDLGKVKLNNQNKNSNITLTIKNDCGDIIVDN